MTLIEAQWLFSRLLPRLLDRAFFLGYRVTVGEAYRSQETSELYALQGKGAKGSLHPLRLAVDLHLFRSRGVSGGRVDYEFLTKTEDHVELGRYWKQCHPLCRWGGDFKRPDGNHYSLTWGGRA